MYNGIEDAPEPLRGSRWQVAEQDRSHASCCPATPAFWATPATLPTPMSFAIRLCQRRALACLTIAGMGALPWSRDWQHTQAALPAIGKRCQPYTRRSTKALVAGRFRATTHRASCKPRGCRRQPRRSGSDAGDYRTSTSLLAALRAGGVRAKLLLRLGLLAGNEVLEGPAGQPVAPIQAGMVLRWPSHGAARVGDMAEEVWPLHIP
mmetsp:Transcript_124969/g.358790  ORF Transcript_124969/g.358790 Transcript_124969/m.358790 type:complete len:207 (-) Transcript_124969:222-842(-)